MWQEVFQDRAKDFPFYDGTIKTEIDSLIKNQTLQFQNDPASIETALSHYRSEKHFNEIQEGKIKSRFASSSATHSSGPGSSGDENKKSIKVTSGRLRKLRGLVG